MRLRDQTKQDNPMRRGCFGILKELEADLAIEGLVDVDVWEYIKNYYKVDSRTELSRTQWSQLVDRLAIAQRNPDKLDGLVRRVWRFKHGQGS